MLDWSSTLLCIKNYSVTVGVNYFICNKGSVPPGGGLIISSNWCTYLYANYKHRVRLSVFMKWSSAIAVANLNLRSSWSRTCKITSRPASPAVSRLVRDCRSTSREVRRRSLALTFVAVISHVQGSHMVVICRLVDSCCMRRCPGDEVVTHR